MPVLTPLTEGAETLSALSELIPLPGLYPSIVTFPSSGTFPSDGVVGLLLTLLSSDTQTLTPLTED